MVLWANVNLFTAVKQRDAFLYVSALACTQHSFPKSLVTPPLPPTLFSLASNHQTRGDSKSLSSYSGFFGDSVNMTVHGSMISKRLHGSFLSPWRNHALLEQGFWGLTVFYLQYFLTGHWNSFSLSHPTSKRYIEYIGTEFLADLSFPPLHPLNVIALSQPL